MRDVLCVVPARSGSTRIRDKNLARVGGRTLLERAVSTAIEAFGSVVVSTDSQAYADVATAAGAEVPALRPAGLAAATTPMDDVVQHALGWAPPTASFLVLVQPTSPFTDAADLLATVRALEDDPVAATALLARRLDRTVGFALVRGADDRFRALAPHLIDRRSQDLPDFMLPTGGAFAARIARLRDGGPLVAEPIVAVAVETKRGTDIDDEHDLATAQALADS